MDQARKTDSVIPSAFIPKQTKSRQDRAGLRCDPGSPPATEDPAPFAAKELKYFWEKYDEARSSRQPHLSNKNIYIGAVGLVLVGCFINLTGLSLPKPLGSILMLAGSVIGVCSILKSLWQEKVRAHRR
ncbi:MAG: hypothetical protein WBV23_03035 [Desulfobaccales bacterium]